MGKTVVVILLFWERPGSSEFWVLLHISNSPNGYRKGQETSLLANLISDGQSSFLPTYSRCPPVQYRFFFYLQELKLAGVEVADLDIKSIGAEEENRTLHAEVKKLQDDLTSTKKGERGSFRHERAHVDHPEAYILYTTNAIFQQFRGRKNNLLEQLSGFLSVPYSKFCTVGS